MLTVLLPGHTRTHLPSSQHFSRTVSPTGKTQGEQTARAQQLTTATKAEQRTPRAPLSAGSC